MTSLSAALLLSAEDPAPKPLSLVCPGLQVVGFDAKIGEFLTEHTAQQMKVAGAEISDERDTDGERACAADVTRRLAVGSRGKD